MATLPRPDFSKVNSLLYLVQLYHDCVWELASVPETFSEWLRRVVPTTRSVGTSDDCVYVCDTHKNDPASTAECSVYTCDAHTTDPASTAECAPFSCPDTTPVPAELYCMSDILNVPVAHMGTFFANADKYYFALVNLLLKRVDIKCIQWSSSPKLHVQFEV